MSWTAPRMINYVAIGSGVSAPHMRDFAVLCGDYFLLFFGGSSIMLKPTTLDIFYARYVIRRHSW